MWTGSRDGSDQRGHDCLHPRVQINVLLEDFNDNYSQEQSRQAYLEDTSIKILLKKRCLMVNLVLRTSLASHFFLTP